MKGDKINEAKEFIENYKNEKEIDREDFEDLKDEIKALQSTIAKKEKRIEKLEKGLSEIKNIREPFLSRDRSLVYSDLINRIKKIAQRLLKPKEDKEGEG